MLRLTPELHGQLKKAAELSNRSLNSEIIWRLRQSFEGWKQI